MANQMGSYLKNDNDLFQNLRERRIRLRSMAGEFDCIPNPKEIDEVILILGSSRTGSSLLTYLLSQHPDLISLQGEEVTFTRLFGLNNINSTEDSDRLSRELNFNAEEIAYEMLCDAGYSSSSFDNSKRLIQDRAQRIMLQWPAIQFDLYELLKSCEVESWGTLIESLAKSYPQISLNKYDQYVDKSVGNSSPLHLIEEPPFIIPKAKTYQSDKSKKKKLLLKSSINAFREELVQKFFPNAEIKYIHLVRHPALSINGLMDGWESNGFHTHNLSHLTKLNISGYEHSDWWKFDLPPGWHEYTNKPLNEVCAFQWHAANESILNFIQNKNPVSIRFENLLQKDSLSLSLQAICKAFGLDDQFLKTITSPPAVMSVGAPDQNRWKKREHLILPMIESKKISSLASELGYGMIE